MTRATRSDLLPCRRRDGFTLIELLVVVAIIGILVALSASAVIRYLGVQQQNNTEVTIRKVNEKLEKQWKAVIDLADKEPLPAAVITMAGGDERRARVIYKKLRLRQEFPMSFWEAINPPAGLPVITDYRQKVAIARPSGPSATSPMPSESAACLLMALQRARKGIVLDAQDLGVSSVIDMDGDGLQEIIDAWGKPLAFIRWPSKNLDLNPDPTGLQGIQHDPVDPEGLLATGSWNPSVVGYSAPASGRSFKLIPVIVSGGPNRQLGIDGNGGITNANQANDNIHNYSLFRLGARGE